MGAADGLLDFPEGGWRAGILAGGGAGVGDFSGLSPAAAAESLGRVAGQPAGGVPRTVVPLLPGPHGRRPDHVGVAPLQEATALRPPVSPRASGSPGFSRTGIA